MMTPTLPLQTPTNHPPTTPNNHHGPGEGIGGAGWGVPGPPIGPRWASACVAAGAAHRFEFPN